MRNILFSLPIFLMVYQGIIAPRTESAEKIKEYEETFLSQVTENLFVESPDSQPEEYCRSVIYKFQDVFAKDTYPEKDEISLAQRVSKCRIKFTQITRDDIFTECFYCQLTITHREGLHGLNYYTIEYFVSKTGPKDPINLTNGFLFKPTNDDSTNWIGGDYYDKQILWDKPELETKELKIITKCLIWLKNERRKPGVTKI